MSAITIEVRQIFANNAAATAMVNVASAAKSALKRLGSSCASHVEGVAAIFTGHVYGDAEDMLPNIRSVMNEQGFRFLSDSTGEDGARYVFTDQPRPF